MAVDLNKEVADGTRAHLLLESPAYKDAVSKVRQGILDAWAGSPLADKDGQHTLRLMLKLLNDIEGNIKEVATTGKLASIQIEQEKAKESALKKILKFGRG